MTTRKTLSKKTRFEIFKRDDFCCAYCGNRPPKVTLEVDHINPVINGGNNSPDNLITSCFDCNRGKGKGLLSNIPESLKDKAKRIKECELQLSEYRKIIDSQESRIKRDAWYVIEELFGSNCNELRSDWFRSVKQFNSLLGRDEVKSAAEIAALKASEKRFTDARKFTYFCAICWNKHKEASNG